MYFSTLLEQRDATDFDPAEWGAKLEDRFYNSKAFMEYSESVNEDEFGESPALGSFQDISDEAESDQLYEDNSELSGQFIEPGTLHQKRISYENDLIKNKAAVIIQAHVRGFLVRKQVRKMREGKNTMEF
ncbi:sperm surface protein Sp17-like [Pleurodeles waltl]